MTLPDYLAIRQRKAPDGTAYKDILPTAKAGLIQTAFSVHDSLGRPIATMIAVRAVEIVLIMEPKHHPLVKLEALAEAHKEMRERILPLGYPHGFAVVPEFLKSYIRHMTRKFGWKRDYPCYRIG